MADAEQSQSADTFSFVDKRHVAESPEDFSGSIDSNTIGTDTDTLSDGEVTPNAPSATAYDVAAYCLGLLITEGFQRMGLIADPQTGKVTVDLPGARVAIDCVAALVGVLDEPTSVFPDTVKREMKRTLNDLRLNYIDRTRT